jgi:pyrroline-5-carboxylate reductase
MKILIIGGGNMGSIYAKSILRSHISSKDNIMILERIQEKHEHLNGLDIGLIHEDPGECVPWADLIIIAVKPQDTPILFEQVSPYVHEQQVILSIMAGITMETISSELKTNKVIRAMPNLPAQVGMGMTAFTSTNDITRLELVMVQNLLNTTGKTIYVENESMIDCATAISGSGPAYVFYFMKALMESAMDMGFNEAEAELLTVQTFKGAVDVYVKSGYSFDDWIKKVSSKGGTTEAAIEQYEIHTLSDFIKDGSSAALKRAIDLGKKK